MSANLSPHPLAALIPPMTEAEAEALRNDIMLHGQREPIVLFEGMVLDGRHRLAACIALKIEPKTTIFAGPEADARALVLSLNLHRRHFTQEQKRALIEAELKFDPTQSDRTIAKKAKVSKNTVAKKRVEAEESGQIDHSSKRTDPRTGKQSQPATKPKKAGYPLKHMRHANVAIERTVSALSGMDKTIERLDVDDLDDGSRVAGWIVDLDRHVSVIKRFAGRLKERKRALPAPDPAAVRPGTAPIADQEDASEENPSPAQRVH